MLKIGVAINLAKNGQAHQFDFISSQTFDVSSTSVNPTSNSFAVLAHGLKTGDVVVFRKLSGPDLGGLTDGSRYFVIRISDNAFKLAATLADANAAVSLQLSVATGLSQFRFERMMVLTPEWVDRRCQEPRQDLGLWRRRIESGQHVGEGRRRSDFGESRG